MGSDKRPFRVLFAHRPPEKNEIIHTIGIGDARRCDGRTGALNILTLEVATSRTYGKAIGLPDAVYVLRGRLHALARESSDGVLRVA